MKKNLLLYFLLIFNFIFSQKIESENITIKDSIQIQTKDHATLSLIIVLNKNKEPQNTILVNTIYPDPKNINLVKNFVENNYVGVILYPRGKYLSENNIEPFEHEAEDINEVIDWIIQQSWSNGKVGMIGGSYLGFSQWAAAKNLHPALKTIVPQAATGVGIAGLPFNNGVFMNYSLQWLEYVTGNKTTDSKSFNDQKKWNSIFKRWYESGKSYRKLDSISGKPNTIFQRWLNHPSYDDYWKKMIPYKEEFSKINIPILSTTGYYDVDRYGALYYFNEHHKYYKKAEHYLIIGPYDHWGSQGFIKNELRGYKIDPVASIDFNKIWIEWFDYIFKNKPKPAFLRNKINYQIMGTNQWKSAESMDVFNEAKTKFYFENNDGKLSLSPFKNRKENFSTLSIDYKERNDAEEVFNLKYNILDQFIYTKNNLLFETKTFDKPFELSGNISGNLNISINKKDVDLYFNLYEKTQDGHYFLLYSYVSRASFAKNKEKRNLLMPGKIETIPIIANDFTSKKIDKGSKLVLMIGVVKNPYWQINYGSGKEVSEETISDAKDPLKIKLYNSSYVEIPILQKE
ncbi:CocE/NonD family hydrolase [Chryseobacterium sp. MMS23-Vi53]|uniref:CocE/NonD family hydrolase n=1 Tax=Chryseobacterium sp. MMS23-Vi53 TaxID=3386644 RepID=UPI0039ED1150